MNKYITPIEDGSSRTITILVDADPSIAIVNAYLPAGNSKADLAEYESTLDEVVDIAEKYESSHQVILLGDLNGSFTRQPPSPRDTALRRFCNEQDWQPAGDLTVASYYHNNNADPTSRIDHIIPVSTSEHLLQNVRVSVREALNTSPHDPVTVVINASARTDTSTSKIAKKTQRSAKRKIPWDKVDIPLYKESVKLGIQHVMDSVDLKTTDTSCLLDHLNTVLYDTSLQCMPEKMRASTVRRKLVTNKSWHPKLKQAVKSCKRNYKIWRDAGRPSCGLLALGRKRSRNKLRSVQRQLAAEARRKEVDEIMNASEGDKPLFYKLVKKQRRTGTNEQAVLFHDEIYTGDRLCQAWADYFEQLATPKNLPEFDNDYMDSVIMRNYILQRRQGDGELVPEITDTLISDYISNLKNAKAPDEFGISSEHLKFAGATVVPIVRTIIENIFKTEQIPEQMKTGVITPVFKNKGTPRAPDNYRRITVTSLVGKILEMAMVEPVKETLKGRLNTLQRGFCRGAGSSNTAFILSEAIAESQDLHTKLYVTFLDASKAFDVVWHTSMLNKLYDLGVDGKLWRLYSDMYSGLTSRVKTTGLLSRTIVERQGVRQGGIPSTELFKGRCDQLLNTLEQSTLGFSIGAIDCSVPTCADDMALLSSTAISLQAMINVAVADANRERYQFNVKKSKVMVMNSNIKPSVWQDLPLWTLSEGNSIAVSNKETHLGIVRTPDCKSGTTVVENIKLARRSLFSLTGAGMYGLNGAHPKPSVHLWNTYIIPRLVYGLDVIPITSRQLEDLEIFQRSNLKRIQHLPPGTPNAAVLLLVGTLPIEAVIDQKVLSLYTNMCRLEDSRERCILQRQLAVKDMSSCSFTTRVKVVLHKYGLPSAFSVLHDPPNKPRWKRLVKQAITSYWNVELRKEASHKTSLLNFSYSACNIGTIHPAWDTAYYSAIDIQRACVKVKMLTHQYLTAEKSAKYKGTSSACPVCLSETETLAHLILYCPITAAERRRGISQLQDEVNPSVWRIIQDDPDKLLQLILDCRHPLVNAYISDRTALRVECISRHMCFGLHRLRALHMQQ
jgi:hypothetical protein